MTQAEAASRLGVCGRTFRRYLSRYEEGGMEGLIDRRLMHVSHRRVPVDDEVMRLTEKYRGRHEEWSAKHLCAWYRKDGGARSYTWVKSRRQEAALVPQAKARGAHRKRRERSPWPGLMIHQDGSRHEGVAGQKWDLIVTMDDATNEPYSMFFVEEEDTMSSLQGIREVIELLGLFSTFYSDRGSHYWPTPEAGGKVDQQNLTPFGQAMKHLGIEMIADCSPEARGRSERMFRTHQDRLPRELALAGITDRADANRYLTGIYRPVFNAEFMQPAMEEGSAFVDWIGGPLGDILCERFERTVGNDHCVSFEGRMNLQTPNDRHRCHHVKAKVAVLRRTDHTLAILHGPRKLADYDEAGKVMPPNLKVAA
ncbi:ISNCY family transposase [Candidatus Accumulibacter cognatus]|uniref:ISNCY family transposase n=1 Tax=Candidatus Accumulibacter cognatus TaxID=2954383 RepID=UPI00235B6825|nr:ISNCY family transposase [Candidatus Accumulibacter cognatus]